MYFVISNHMLIATVFITFLAVKRGSLNNSGKHASFRLFCLGFSQLHTITTKCHIDSYMYQVSCYHIKQHYIKHANYSLLTASTLRCGYVLDKFLAHALHNYHCEYYKSREFIPAQFLLPSSTLSSSCIFCIVSNNLFVMFRSIIMIVWN